MNAEEMDEEMDEQFMAHINTLRPMKRADYRRAARAQAKADQERRFIERVLRRRAKGLMT